MVNFLQHPEYPQFQLFRCTILHADLTAQSCARNHCTATAIQCVRCEIGIQHAKILPPNEESNPNIRGTRPALPCVRCEECTYRLISGLICVPCYNREREVKAGKNAKGTFPKILTKTLHPARLLIDDGGKDKLIDLPLCSGIQEAQRIVKRKWPSSTLYDYEILPVPISIKASFPAVS